MRRTIKQQPMSLQEIAERKEQAEQRIHAADGLLAQAEAMRADIIAEHNELAVKLEDVDALIIEREAELSAFEEDCKKAEAQKRKLEAEVKELMSQRDAAMVELTQKELIEQLKRDQELKDHRDTLAALVVAKDKVRSEFNEISQIVEERKAKAQHLSDTVRGLELKREEIEREIASLEPRKEELAELNKTILERKDAIVGISEEYARQVELVDREKRHLLDAKAQTEQELKYAQEVRESLARDEASVEAKIISLKAIQDNLETMRIRMERAQRDAEAKEFLAKGY